MIWNVRILLIIHSNIRAGSRRFGLPEHVHTTFTLVDNVHFVQKIIPDLGVSDLQGLYDLPDSRDGGFDAGLEQSRVRASVENVGILAERLRLNSLTCPTRHY